MSASLGCVPVTDDVIVEVIEPQDNDDSSIVNIYEITTESITEPTHVQTNIGHSRPPSAIEIPSATSSETAEPTMTVEIYESPASLQSPSPLPETTEEPTTIVAVHEGSGCGIDYLTNGLIQAATVTENMTKSVFPCTTCDKKFSTAGNRKRHSINAHAYNRLQCREKRKGKIYQCDTCDDKFFSHKEGLRLHNLKHKNIYKYLCPTCGKGYNRKRDFEGHYAIHEDSKPFDCPKCGKQFRNQSNQLTHSKGCGSKVQPFTCDSCGKKFKCARYLKEHNKMHSASITKFQCATCGKEYYFRSSFKKHMKTHDRE